MESSIWNTFLVSCTTFGVVFFVFVLLYFVMRAMALVSKFDKEPEAAVVPPPALAPAAQAAPAAVVSPEIVAAITAALVADLGEDNFTITSITPVARVSGSNQANSNWAQAGRGQQLQNFQSR